MDFFYYIENDNVPDKFNKKVNLPNVKNIHKYKNDLPNL